MSRFRLPIVLLGGAAVLAVLRGPMGLTFNITPLAVGVIALLAAATLPRPRPWTSGIVASAWGIGVLLVREGPLPPREASIYMIAIAIGLLVASLVSPRSAQGDVVRGGAITILLGGVLFYLAFDVALLQEWWVFPAGVATAALVEAVRA